MAVYISSFHLCLEFALIGCANIDDYCRKFACVSGDVVYHMEMPVRRRRDEGNEHRGLSCGFWGKGDSADKQVWG